MFKKNSFGTFNANINFVNDSALIFYDYLVHREESSAFFYTK